MDRHQRPVPRQSITGALPPSRPLQISAEDVSIARLSTIASWIRDHLDPRIACEGPEVMHPDDVLALHDIFTVLQGASLSTTTLRISRIHKAILEVSGKATRWPRRLADECDKLIILWSHIYGPLEALRPFLYGRGGRLEDVANVGDVTRAALLKRWMETVPALVAPEQSRRHGDLGFVAGDWWLNSLFAYRAGIIDLETTEDGICFDSNGAYALLLRDNDEVDGTSPSTFTYRCPRNNPGRFRLTAADFRSRYPVRILRSHNLRSLFAPRAGVRYEGLYRVSGWKIRGITDTEAKKTGFKLGELIFDVKFDRQEAGQRSMEDVLRKPTAADIDDYAEFKRLRRLQRENIRHPERGGSELQDVEYGTDLESPIETPKLSPGLEAASEVNLVPARVIRTESMVSKNDTQGLSMALPRKVSGFIPSGALRQLPLGAIPSVQHPGTPISFSEDLLSSLSTPNMGRSHTSTINEASNSEGSSPANSECQRRFQVTPPIRSAESLDVPRSRTSSKLVLNPRDSPATAYIAATNLALNEIAPWVDQVPQKFSDRSGLLLDVAHKAEQSSKSVSCGSPRTFHTSSSPHFRSTHSGSPVVEDSSTVRPLEDTAPWTNVDRASNDAFTSTMPTPSRLSELSRTSLPNPPPSDVQHSRKGSIISGSPKFIMIGGKTSSAKGGEAPSLQGSTLTNPQREGRRARRKKQDMKKADDEEKIGDERQRKGLPRLSLSPLMKKGNILGRLFDGSAEARSDVRDNEESDAFTIDVPDLLSGQQRLKTIGLGLTAEIADRPLSDRVPSTDFTKSSKLSIMPSNEMSRLPHEFSPIYQKLAPITDQEWYGLHRLRGDLRSPTVPKTPPRIGGLRPMNIANDAVSPYVLPLAKTSTRTRIGSLHHEHVFASVWPAASKSPTLHHRSRNYVDVGAEVDGENGPRKSSTPTTSPESSHTPPKASSVALAQTSGNDRRHSSQMSHGSSDESPGVSHSKSQKSKADKKEKEWDALKKWQRDRVDEAYNEAVSKQDGGKAMMREDSPDGDDVHGMVMFTDPFAQRTKEPNPALRGGANPSVTQAGGSTTPSASAEQTKTTLKKPSAEIAPEEHT